MPTLAGQDGAPLSGLMLCGVPVEALSGVTGLDLGSAPYGLVGYGARRPAGTPLLPEPAGAVQDSPPAYLRDALIQTLANRAGGASPQDSRSVATDDDMRIAAQLQMALAEAAAETSGGPLAAPAAAPVSPTPDGLGSTFAAAQSPVPPWLTAAIALSYPRATAVSPADPSPAPSPGEDPVAYAASASAFWQGLSPHSAGDSATGRERAQALGAAARLGAEIFPPPFYVGAAVRAPPPPPPDWLADAAAALAGRLGEGEAPSAPVPAPAVGPQGLGGLLAERYAEALREPPAAAGRPVFVLSHESVLAVLATMDVMREHELRDMRG